MDSLSWVSASKIYLCVWNCAGLSGLPRIDNQLKHLSFIIAIFESQKKVPSSSIGVSVSFAVDLLRKQTLLAVPSVYMLVA